MKNIFAILLTYLVMPLISVSQTKTVSDVTVPATLSVGDKNLVLNGAGSREKYFMDMYVGSLYLIAKSSDASKIISTNETMGITLNIVSGLITSSRMTEAINEGFDKSTKKNIAPLKTKIDVFTKIFSEQINKSDVFKIVYDPKDGTTIYKNGTKKGTIEGIDFKKALWGIWLGDDPADSGLKSAMLGK